MRKVKIIRSIFANHDQIEEKINKFISKNNYQLINVDMNIYFNEKKSLDRYTATIIYDDNN